MPKTFGATCRPNVFAPRFSRASGIRAPEFSAQKRISVHVAGETCPKRSTKWPKKPKRSTKLDKLVKMSAKLEKLAKRGHQSCLAKTSNKYFFLNRTQCGEISSAPSSTLPCAKSAQKCAEPDASAWENAWRSGWKFAILVPSHFFV